MNRSLPMKPTVMVVGNLEKTSGDETPHIRDMRFHFDGAPPAPREAVVIQAEWDDEKWIWVVTQWRRMESSLEPEPQAAVVEEVAEAQPTSEQTSTDSDRCDPEATSAAALDATRTPEATTAAPKASAQRQGFAFGAKSPSAPTKGPATAPNPAAGPTGQSTATQTPNSSAVAETHEHAEPRSGFAFGPKPSQPAPSTAPRRMYTPPRPPARPGSSQQGTSGTASTVKTTAKPAPSTVPASQRPQPLSAAPTQARAAVPVRPPQQAGAAQRRGGFGMGPSEAHAAADMPAPFPAASAETRGTLNSPNSDDHLRQWGMDPSQDYEALDIPF